MVTGLVFGLIAALPAARVDLVSSIRDSQRSATAGKSRNRGRDVLIASEAALAMMLLAGAGLLIESFVNLRRTDLGFDSAGLVTVSMRRPPEEYRDSERAADFESRLIERLRAIPGVGAVAAASTFPLERGMNIPMTIEGRPDASEGGSEWRGVSAAYFETLGLPLVRGRAFTEAEARAGLPVILVNEAFAKRWFPDGDALGEHVLVGHFRGEPISPSWSDPSREIIGIVADMRESGPGDPPKRTMFVPHAQTRGMFGMSEIILRTRAPNALAIDAAVREVDPRMPTPRLETVNDRLRETLAPDRFNMLLMSLFAAAALALTVIGIYGVVAFVVRQRTAEIGIRMALGAAKGEVVREAVARGMAPVLAGLVLGAAGAAALTRFLSSMLFGVSAIDPTTYVSVAIVLATAGAIACFRPARRAAAVDPMRALRIE
jgi:putative ABC transport system permease protein